jgi:hypothetical protein
LTSKWADAIHSTNFFLERSTINGVPTKVAAPYSHKFPTEPESRAGAKDLAGFFEAPEISDKNRMS